MVRHSSNAGRRAVADSFQSSGREGGGANSLALFDSTLGHRRTASSCKNTILYLVARRQVPDDWAADAFEPSRPGD